MAVNVVPPGAGHPRARSSRSDKYYLITQGTVEFTLDGSKLSLAKGDFCFIERGKWFSYANPSEREAELVLMHSPDFVLSAEEFAEA